MSLAIAIGALRDAYPTTEFPDRTVALYARMLADMDEAAVTRAVKRLIQGSRFLPKIAEIREAVAEEQLALPTPEEAWDIALRGSLRDAPPEVRAAVEASGGRWRILHSDSLEAVRAQFHRDYTGRRATAIETLAGARVPTALPPGDIALGETMRALPETTRFHPRPVIARLTRRMSGRTLAPPTEEEKSDAIRVLGEGPMSEEDTLYAEAERIFIEASE